MLTTLLFTLLLAGSATAQTKTKKCEDLAYAIEAETTNRIMQYLTMVTSEVKKLIMMTNDFIEPLELVDIFPWENDGTDAGKLRVSGSVWEASDSDSKAQKVAGTYSEEGTEAEKMRQILFENLKRQSEKRPLIWYAMGLEPVKQTNVDGVPTPLGAYFGLSQYLNDEITPGQYIYDTTLATDPSVIVGTGLCPTGEKTTENTGCTERKGYNWMRFGLTDGGAPVFDNAIDNWGGFEPTIRPWYQQGKASRNPVFLNPYVMVSTAENSDKTALGVGVVAQIRKNEAIMGVLDAEFGVDDFSNMLADQREAGDGGLLYIYSVTSSNVIAISSSDRSKLIGEGALYAADADHPEPLVAGTAPTVMAATSYPFSQQIEVDGTNYFVYADEYDASVDLQMGGLDWVVVTAWPTFECDTVVEVQTDVDTNNTAVVVLAVIVVLLLVVLCAVVMRLKQANVVMTNTVQ